MRPSVEAAVDQCLSWLCEGMDMETCLSRYPEYTEELRPLLEVAAGVVRIRLPAPQASARAAGQQRMLAALAQKQAGMAQANPIARSVRRVFWPLLPGRPGSLRPAWQLAGAILVILLLAGGWTTVAASAGSVPGDLLYPVKLASQGAQLALTLDPARQQLAADRFETQRRLDIQTALSGGHRAAVEFQGELQQIEGDLWIVGGLPLAIQETTVITGQPFPGAEVRVRADLPGNGELVASWVEIESSMTPEPTDTRQPTSTPEPTQTPKEVETEEPTPAPEPTTTLGEIETPTPVEPPEEERVPELSRTAEPDDAGEDEQAPEPTETPEADDAGEDEQDPDPAETSETDDAGEDGQAPEPTETLEPDDAGEDEQGPDPGEDEEESDPGEDEEEPDPGEDEEEPDPGEDEEESEPTEEPGD